MNIKNLIGFTLGRAFVATVGNGRFTRVEKQDRRARSRNRAPSRADEGRPASPMMTGVPPIPRLW
jgi:hypothetical protein